MAPELCITQFLENYRKSDKVHQRAYEMLYDSYRDPGALGEILQSLVDSDVNVSNLAPLLDKVKENDEATAPHAIFDGAGETKYDFGLDSPAGQPPAAVPQPKRLRVREQSEEAEFAIPGIKLVPEQEEAARERVQAPPARLPSNEQANKRVLTNTVFYQSILPEPKSRLEAERDPYYLFPVLQCKLCGLRFPKEHAETFGLHIEDHRRFTHALGEKTMLRREFFHTKTQARIEKLDLVIEGGAEDVVWEEECPSCIVCGKLIKKRWNDELENWVLDDGTKINEKEVAHRKCVY